MAAPPHRQPDLRRRLAGWLRRLATAVAPPEPPARPVEPPADGEPPEHWLEVVRSRAPQLLERRPSPAPRRVAPPGGRAALPADPSDAEYLGRRAAPGAAEPGRSGEPEFDGPDGDDELDATVPPWPEAETRARRGRTAPNWADTAGPAGPASRVGPADTAGAAGNSGPAGTLARLASRLLSWPVELVKRVVRADFGPERRVRSGSPVPTPRLDADTGERTGREPTLDGTTPRFPEDDLPGRRNVTSARRPAIDTEDTVTTARPANADTNGKADHPRRRPDARTPRVTAEFGDRPARRRPTPPEPRDGAAGARNTAVRTDDTRDWDGAGRRLGGWGEPAREPVWEQSVAADRWPELPDDGGLWVAPVPAFAADRVRRLEREQRGR